MFEFRYRLSLGILHPSIDPAQISLLLKRKPKIQRLVGEEIVNKKGVSSGRKSKASYWLAVLHDEQLVESGTRPISEAILHAAKELQPHEQFFKRIKEEGGEIEFRIAWFGNSSNSTGVLEAEALQLCGSLGINILLDVYGLEHQPRAGGPAETATTVRAG